MLVMASTFPSQSVIPLKRTTHINKSRKQTQDTNKVRTFLHVIPTIWDSTIHEPISVHNLIYPSIKELRSRYYLQLLTHTIKMFRIELADPV